VVGVVVDVEGAAVEVEAEVEVVVLAVVELEVDVEVELVVVVELDEDVVVEDGEQDSVTLVTTPVTGSWIDDNGVPGATLTVK